MTSIHNPRKYRALPHRLMGTALKSIMRNPGSTYQVRLARILMARSQVAQPSKLKFAGNVLSPSLKTLV